ncbi:MAG: response regulator [Polyangiales bacterium]
MAPPPGPDRPWRTLIIEDNRAFAENIAEMLSEDGHEPHCFSNGRDALAFAQGHGFDLAFLDVRLPDANGTDLLVQLKEASALAEVIVMSGDATIESAIATVRGGAFAFILKPFATEEVLRLAAMATRQVALRREREALVRRLQHSEERYRTVVEVSPALIIAADQGGTVTLVNAAVERTTGFPRAALLGRAFETLVPEAQREAAWPPPKPDGPFELSLRTEGGAERRIEWRTGGSEELVYLIGMDVTETRAIERRVRAAEQLAMVGELTAGLAHEIRNPLNSALLELKVLTRRLSRAQDDAGVASVDVVRGELERLERLLADFLWFARPGTRSTLPGYLSSPASPSRGSSRPRPASGTSRSPPTSRRTSRPSPSTRTASGRSRSTWCATRSRRSSATDTSCSARAPAARSSSSRSRTTARGSPATRSGSSTRSTRRRRRARASGSRSRSASRRTTAASSASRADRVARSSRSRSPRSGRADAHAASLHGGRRREARISSRGRGRARSRCGSRGPRRRPGTRDLERGVAAGRARGMVTKIGRCVPAKGSVTSRSGIT